LGTRHRQHWEQDTATLGTRHRQHWEQDTDNIGNKTQATLGTRHRQHWKQDTGNIGKDNIYVKGKGSSDTPSEQLVFEYDIFYKHQFGKYAETFDI
jgi:hypothetical protein